jgi:lysozyme
MKAIDLIKQFEGCRLFAYRDSVGIPTIGYGHTDGVTMDQIITPSEAEDILAEDLQKFEDGVRMLAPGATGNQFAALTSFAFNVGLRALGTSTLLRRFLAGDIQGAADEFLHWNKGHVAGVLVELEGLTKRRRAEREVFLTPDN